MAAGVPQDRMLIGPLQDMVDQTGVGMEKEDPGQMMSTGFQENAVIALQKATAVLCRLCIAGVDTTAAPVMDVEGPGAQ